MQHSEQINELAAAMASAQASIVGAKKDSANPFYKSSYADLESVWTACREALTKNGLSVIQGTSSDAEGVTVTTLLTHKSGQWVKDSLRMIPKDGSPQAFGSCISYARRYSLASMVGVYQTDDDAEAAQPRNESAARSKATKEANKYATRIIEALNMDMESAAADVMREAKDVSEDFAADVWHCLSTPIRNRLREISKQVAA